MERKIRFVEALREGMRQEMQRDKRVFVLGECVGPHGSCYKQTVGFCDEFGEDRCRDRPISELAIAGAAVGAAIAGMRPIAVIASPGEEVDVDGLLNDFEAGQ